MLPYPKKRLGQNFLVDKNIRRKIVAALELNPEDIVLEIGSGRGELTTLIAPQVSKLYALEVDTALCALIPGTHNLFPVDKKPEISNVSPEKNLTVINADILKFDIKKYFSKVKGKIKVVGNIPYYISSPIIERLIKYRDKISVIYLTVQKEFAQRVVALPGSKNYGCFSCFVGYYLRPRIIMDIKKTCFYPSPKVDSSLVRLEVREEPEFSVKNPALLFKLIHTAFGQRRKTLLSSLKEAVPDLALQEFFAKNNIDNRIRPERLSLKDFAELANIVSSGKKQKKS